jgi:glycosyltransferase involved in cell wall biosynthesis
LKYVVVDAGSRDGSRRIIRNFGNEIDLMICEPDSGPANGLNKGFRECADCDVLGYLNSDDRFTPGALDWVLEFFRSHPEVDCLVGAIAIIGPRGCRSCRARVPDRFDLRKYAIDACNVFQQGTFFRRRAFEQTGGFNEQNRTCWDGELLVDLALAGGRFARTRRILGEFRIHHESITGSGRSTGQYRQDRTRIREKIESAGVPPYLAWQANMLRLVRRANPIRQVSYFLAS